MDVFVYQPVRSYQTGYDEGIEDGKIAGIQEGSGFGMQTGFQRYVALGVLNGRIKVWRVQIENVQKRLNQQLDSATFDLKTSEGGKTTEITGETETKIKSDTHLSEKDVEALKKQLDKTTTAIDSLQKLIDPETVPKTNSDDDVARLELALRKSKSKAKIISTYINKLMSYYDSNYEDPPIIYFDSRISQLLKPIDQVMEEFRI